MESRTESQHNRLLIRAHTALHPFEPTYQPNVMCKWRRPQTKINNPILICQKRISRAHKLKCSWQWRVIMSAEMTTVDLRQTVNVKCQREPGVVNIFLAVRLQRREQRVPSAHYRYYDRRKSLLATLPKPLTLINQLPLAPNWPARISLRSSRN